MKVASFLPQKNRQKCLGSRVTGVGSRGVVGGGDHGVVGGVGGGSLVIGEVNGRRRLLQRARRLLLILHLELRHLHLKVKVPCLLPLVLQVLDDVGFEDLATLQKKRLKNPEKEGKKRVLPLGRKPHRSP